MSALQSLSSLVLHSSLVLAAATLLPACGGGETPQLATSEACVPAESVRIQLFGDSTQWAQGSAVQDWMDARYGVGLVRVSNHGVSGTTAADFPKSLVEPGAITVVNYGINDARVTSASVDVYKARLRAINATVYQTPNPPIDDYAQPMRDVAAELGRPMIEVSANVRALPGGTSATTDGVHPNEILYAWITHQLVAPELASLVDTKLCFASRQGVTVTSNTAAIIWAAKDGAPRSGRVVFTNSDSSAVALSFGGLGAPYSIAPANCIAAPHGGSCVVEVTLDTSGTPGGQGTQVLRATLANGSTVVVPVWGILNNF